MQNKLLPCPFCGGEAEVNYNESTSLIPFFIVLCRECGCKQSGSISKEAVINAWNTRKPMERIVERLEVLHELVNMNQKLAVSQSISIVKAGGTDAE